MHLRLRITTIRIKVGSITLKPEKNSISSLGNGIEGEKKINKCKTKHDGINGP